MDFFCCFAKVNVKVKVNRVFYFVVGRISKADNPSETRVVRQDGTG